MIIITEDTERKLLHTLKAFLRNTVAMSSIHFKISTDVISDATLHSVITDLVRQEISSPDVTLYFCEDAEIFVMASSIRMREAHKLALSVAHALHMPAGTCGFTYSDLSEKAAKLFQFLEAKVEQQDRKLVEEEKFAKHTQELRLKRHNILNVAVTPNTVERISKQRENRKAHEIMVIEDDVFTRKLVEKAVGKEFHTTGLSEPDHALSIYTNLAPNILFLDINLPSVTGHELLEKILQLDPHAYVVMLSGNADQHNISEAIRRGAKGFIAKPFTPDKLHQYIQRCPTIH